ncbi:MAG: hypothetical protein ABL973_14800 [Micropepsaceae bacterium]
MKSKTINNNHVLLMVGCLALASCETVNTVSKPVDPQPPQSTESELVATAATPRPQPVVVRSEIVPDDPEPAVTPAAQPATHSKPAIARATASRPVVSDEPASTEAKPVPAPAAVAEPKPASKPAPAAASSSEPAPVQPPAASTPATPPSTPEAAAPPTSISPPETAADTATGPSASKTEQPPTSIFSGSSSWLKDVQARLQAPIGGMPLWLVVSFALLAFISLVMGFRGKKAPELKDEPLTA